MYQKSCLQSFASLRLWGKTVAARIHRKHETSVCAGSMLGKRLWRWPNFEPAEPRRFLSVKLLLSQN